MWKSAWSSSPKLDIWAAVLPKVSLVHLRISSVVDASSFSFMAASSGSVKRGVTCGSF